MATNFPGSQDNFTNPTSTSSLSQPSHSQQHADVNDAVEAIEGALLDGAPLHIDDANERVGIGTASPNYKLDVAGDIRISNIDPVLVLDDTDGTVGGSLNAKVSLKGAGTDAGVLGFNNTGSGILTLTNEDGAVWLQTKSNNSLVLRTNNSNRLTVDGSGNVDVVSGDLSIGGTAVGKWTQFTPNWTNFTPGSATENWRYAVVNDMLFIEGRTILASDSSMGTRPEFDLPNSYSLANLGQPFGTVNMLESGVQSNVGTVIPGSTTSLRFNYFLVSASSLVRQADITSNAPFAWGSGDQIRACVTVRLM